MHDLGWDLTKTSLWRVSGVERGTAELGALAISASGRSGLRYRVGPCRRLGARAVHILATNLACDARTAILKPRAGRWAAGRSGASPRVLRGEAEFKVREGALLLTLPAVGSTLLEIGG